MVMIVGDVMCYLLLVLGKELGCVVFLGGEFGFVKIVIGFWGFLK